MKKLVGITVGWLMAFLLLGISPLWAQEEAGNYFTITGVVKNKDNKRKLENVNVSVPGTNIGTVTNADGVFSLKIKDTETIQGLEVSHIGYLNSQVSLKENKDISDLTIWMLPAPNLLSEILTTDASMWFILSRSGKSRHLFIVEHCILIRRMEPWYRLA